MFVLLVTLCGSLQIALDFRMQSEYYKDSRHHIKMALSGKQDSEPAGDETDSIFFIKDMGSFSSAFITSLKVFEDHQNLASVSDSLFEVEPDSNSTEYKLEVYYKGQDYLTDGHQTIKYLNLEESVLEDLTEDNFQEKIDLGFDIRNASQLRYFLSSVYLMKAKSEGMVLLSFGSEDSLSCKNWTVEVNYDLNMKDYIEVTQSAEHNEIECRDEWRGFVFAEANPNEENPIRKKVS